MKQNKWLRILILSLFIPSMILASGQYLSPLPVPTQVVINLDTESCNSSCLKKYYEEGMIFSFLANINESNQNSKILEYMNEALGQSEVSEIPYYLEGKKEAFNIALFFPRKSIGRYSTSTANVILSYLLYQKGNFNFEIFDTLSESQEDIANTLQIIEAKGYKKAIGILTYEGANNLNALQPQIEIFIPSVNASQITDSLASNITWGGIAYDEQIKKLSNLGKASPAVSFYDSGFIGQQMNQSVAKYNDEVIYSHAFDLKDISRFPEVIKKVRGSLRNAKIFLNTPVTSSSVILSQLTYNDIKHLGVYSPQINYNPSLLSITQEKDRQNLFIANSITPIDSQFVEQTHLLHADLEYDWINYATAYGIEYFYLKSIPRTKRLFKERVKNHQVEYKIEILSPQANRFSPI